MSDLIGISIPAMLKIAALIAGIMTGAAYFVLLERRICAWVQDRRGPNRVGLPLSVIVSKWKDWSLFGLGQPAADGLKMIFKEEYTPAHVDRRIFVLAPMIILSSALAIYAVIPFGSQIPALDTMPVVGSWLFAESELAFVHEPMDLIVAPQLDVGLIYIFALSGIAVYGVILGGWSSNNKYGFLGALRSSAQMIAYELPLGLGILGVVLATGSLKLDAIIGQQADTGVWFILAQPLGFIVFMVAAFAEAGRLPFDLPEAEQELIGGYHTEYAGMKLLMFLTAEFIHMITASFLMVILFFGGWHLWGLTGSTTDEITWGLALLRILVLCGKTTMMIVFFMLVRWSWPRFRFDQLMTLAWKVMLPLGLVNLICVAILTEAAHVGWFGGLFSSRIAIVVFGWLIAVGGWMAVAMIAPLITDNRPRLDMEEQGIDPQIGPSVG